MAATLQPEEWARHSAALRHLARSLLRDHSTADDLVQSTLVTALTRPPRVLSRAWFERVLRNGVADHRRNQARHATKLAGLEGRTGGGDDSPRAPDTAEIVEQLESFQQLSQLLRGLREDYQRVVFMRYFDDLSPRQIAARLGIPTKTVKTRLHRALAELRQRLERKYGPGTHGWGAALLPLAGSSKAAVAVAGSGAGGVSLAAALGAGGFMIKRIVLVVLVLGLGVTGFYLLPSAAAPADSGLPDTAHTADWFDLAPGEDKDIGTLATNPGGSLRLRITREPGTEALEPRFYISQRDIKHSRRIEPDRVDEVVVENLSVGTHSLNGYAKGVMTVVGAEFVVETGAETVLQVVFRAAVERGFDLVTPAEPSVRKEFTSWSARRTGPSVRSTPFSQAPTSRAACIATKCCCRRDATRSSPIRIRA